MPRAVQTFGAVALGLLFGFASAAEAQTAQVGHRHHAGQPAAEGHQIVVHARESWLTAGTSAPVGSYSGYALDTISSSAPFTPFVDHTTVGVMGLDRIPNNYTLPGCCAP